MIDLTIDEKRALRMRLAEPEDDPFLYEVVSSTIVDTYAAQGGDRRQIEPMLTIQYQSQKNTYRKRYPQAQHYILQANGEDIGRIYVNFGEDEVRILDITLLTRFRGQGRGTRILQEFQRVAEEQGKPIRIYVEEGNPSFNLFYRLGFKKIGKWEPVHHLLEWRSE